MQQFKINSVLKGEKSNQLVLTIMDRAHSQRLEPLIPKRQLPGNSWLYTSANPEDFSLDENKAKSSIPKEDFNGYQLTFDKESNKVQVVPIHWFTALEGDLSFIESKVAKSLDILQHKKFFDMLKEDNEVLQTPTGMRIKRNKNPEDLPTALMDEISTSFKGQQQTIKEEFTTELLGTLNQKLKEKQAKLTKK